MNSANILVTGGAGFIGSHICKQLSKAGYVPVVYDHLKRGHAGFVKWGPLETGDLTDGGAVIQVMRKYRPKGVVHLAAYAYVSESVAEPIAYYRNNVVGTINLLHAMDVAGVDNMVYSSTCAVYGIPTSVPVREDHPHSPVSPYGRTKSMAEAILRDVSDQCGIRSFSLRYFNAAGADPDGELGELHDPETHLIPLVLETAAGLRPHVDIYGGDYATKDGTCIRDFVHVSDLADAHLLALQTLGQGHPTSSYNLGNGNGFSVLDVIAAARQVTGRPIPYVIKPRRNGDPDLLVSDSSRAARDLGWSPRFPSIHQMLEHAWNWRRKQL